MTRAGSDGEISGRGRIALQRPSRDAWRGILVLPPPQRCAYRRHLPRFVSHLIASSRVACSRPIWASRCSCVSAMVVIISASVPATSSSRAEAYRPWWRRWLAS
jgi:hypothetical protein